MARPTVSLSFRITSEKAKKLDRISVATARSRSWILEQALDDFLETQAWHVEHIQEGLSEIQKEKGVPHEKVRAWLTSWGTSKEKTRPR